MKRFVRPGAFLLLAALLFCLSGCYSGNIDQYFSLPMASEEYRQLQSLIDEELASGSEYAAPTHGSYRQSVQLSDVDGDGADEALAFFRDSGKNPKINIYSSEDGEYRRGLIHRTDRLCRSHRRRAEGAPGFVADLLGRVRSLRLFSRGMERRCAFEHRQRRVRHRRHQPRRPR